ncbi:mucin-5AC-like [Lucilia sericata]|uniref:mucin-5AC-like n=1 Tax=Lucilia sericata TaxID=13632 RepID=UPI0018A8203D|nr:mucin-5AC-like [Lucilia sericata]
MSEEGKCPSYPVRGLTISGDPIPTAATPGCGESNVTGTRVSQVVAPGLSNSQATGTTTTTTKLASSRPKLVACKPIPPTKPSVVGKVPSGEVPLPVVASTSAAARAALADQKSASSLPSGDKKVSYVPPCAKEESSTPMSGSSSAPPPTLEKSSNSMSGSSSVPADSQRHKTPSRRAFAHRLAAERIVERHGAKPNNVLSKDEKSSLEWSKNILARQYDSDPPAKAVVAKSAAEAPKRQRSEEESPS